MSFFVMMIIFLIALVVASIMLFEIKMSRGIANSIPAFYAADAGAEQCLYEARKTSGGCANVGGTVNYSLSNGAAVSATRITNQQIQSSGIFSQTKRKIQVDW
ncbi:hypothetical protein KJ853_00375 [Patescibacteria group bacterium]|nr:hypothetical protein [Patescibacteria group bacterium]